MKRIGLYLDVAPDAGGMFQYAQAVLDAMEALPEDRYVPVIAYGNPAWRPYLERTQLDFHALPRSRMVTRLPDALMALMIPPGPSRWISSTVNPLAIQLAKLGCDAWIFPAQEALGYQLRTRSVVSIHDLMHRYEGHFPEVRSRFRFAIREHRFRNIARQSAAVLVDSGVGRGHVVESYGVSPEKVFALPYVAARYLREYAERPDLTQHYRLPEKFLFYPAQFWHHKNHLRLVQAMAQVARDCPEIALVLSGAQRHNFPEVRALVEKLGLASKVRFVGYVPDADLAGFYRRARALVMPTFFGPTNIPPLEAMATGCPVLISGIYGMPEQCGDAALYFDPKSVEQIADAMQRIWTDDALAAELSRRGLERSKLHGQAEFNRLFRNVVDQVVLQEPGA